MSFLNPSLKKPILMAAVMTLLCGSALAADGPHHQLDTNGDQQLSKSEFLAGAAARFDAADVNRDNFLSTDERQDQRRLRREKRQDRRFAKADANNDGQISKDEFDSLKAARREASKARREAMQAKRDLNGDGQIDADERAAFKAERQARKAERRAERKALKQERKARRSKGLDRLERPDANQDGFVSRNEHMAAAERMFTLLDANGDGVLSQGEGTKRGKKRRKRQKKRG